MCDLPTDLLALADAVERDDGEGIFELTERAIDAVWPNDAGRPSGRHVARAAWLTARYHECPTLLLGPIAMMRPSDRNWTVEAYINGSGALIEMYDGEGTTPYTGFHPELEASASLAALLRAHAGREG